MGLLRTTRRRVLAFGAGGAAVLAAGEALRWFAFGYELDVAPVALSVKEFVVVRALVEALCPADGAFPSGLSLGVAERIDEEVFSQSEALQGDMKAAVEAIEHAPILVGVPHRMSALPVDERAAVFQKIMRRAPSVIVQAGTALQQMISLFYYGVDGSWAAIGYDGPWQKTPSPPPSHARYLAAVRVSKAGGAP